MNYNDVLRRLRFALDLRDADMIRLFGLSGIELDGAELTGLLARDDDAQWIACSDARLTAFLDGLVIDRRGPRDPSAPPLPLPGPLDNNLILKKLRIALELKEQDMLGVLKKGGMTLSASELGALFRSRSHRHYRVCGDQLLRNFLAGLAAGRA